MTGRTVRAMKLGRQDKDPTGEEAVLSAALQSECWARSKARSLGPWFTGGWGRTTPQTQMETYGTVAIT